MGDNGSTIITYTSDKPDAIIEAVTNGTDIKPGHVVTNVGESNEEDIDLCGQTETPLGVVLCNPDHNIDDAYSDNTTVQVARCGSGCKVRVWYQANGGDAQKGEIVVLGSEAGKVVVYGYTDGAVNTDTLATKVGRLAEAVTNDATDDQVVEVWLD